LEDIPLLVEYFIGDYVSRAQRLVTGASNQVLDLFRQYWWPGNIRELENVIARAVFKGKSGLIRLEDLPSDFGKRMTAPPVTLGNHDELCQAYSRQLFERALEHRDGDRSKAQKVLGLSRARFYRLLKLHGLNDRSDNGRDSGHNPHGSELIV
jgi:transcriptional regulator with PAS, ATPase and Fis domain